MSANTKSCPVCGGDVPLSRSGRRPRIYDTVRCKNIAADRARRERIQQGLLPGPQGKLIDMTGRRYGRLVAIECVGSKPGHTLWRFRCDCGGERVAAGHSVRRGQVKQCRACAAAARRTSAAARAPGAQYGRCSWCKRPALRRARYECVACNRQAGRYGRDATGRPISRGRRPVLGEVARA